MSTEVDELVTEEDKLAVRMQQCSEFCRAGGKCVSRYAGLRIGAV